MISLVVALNMCRAFTQSPAIGGLPPAVSPICVALLLLLLATHVLPKIATLAFVCVHMRVKRPEAHWPTASDLLGASLKAQLRAGFFFSYCVGIAAVRGAFYHHFTYSLRAEAADADVARQLATDFGLVASDQTGDLRDAMLDFCKVCNLVSFNLPELFVIHQATSTCRSESLECYPSSAN